jgi:hypothetical protein
MLLALYGLDFLSRELIRRFPSLPYHVITSLVIVMPTVGYLDTLRLMVVGQTAAPYQLGIVMILNAAHGLKVLYFIYHRFAFSIFGQSVSQLTVALFLSFLKFRYSIDDAAANFPHLSDSVVRRWKCPDCDPSRLVAISKAQSFLEFLLTLGLYSGLVVAAFFAGCRALGEKLVVESVGLIANLMESTVSVPMFIKIVVRRDISDVSLILVLQYLFGDMMKIVLFIMARTPWSFLFGAFCQLTLDSILFITYFHHLFRAGGAKGEGDPNGAIEKIPVEKDHEIQTERQ